MIPAAFRLKLSREQKKIVAAVVASILIHIFLVFTIAFFLFFQPPTVAPKEEEPPLEFTIIDPPEPEPVKSTPTYVDSSASTEQEKPNENTPFESDKNTRAASALPASGNAPLPSTEGREDTSLELRNQEYTAGRQPQPASPPAPPPQPPQSVQRDTPREDSQPTPRHTTQLALLEPPKSREVPKPAPETQQKPQDQQQPQPPAPTTPPSAPSAPGYQPQTRVTRIRGNISNRGRASIAANATPLGRYKKMLADAIGSRWYYYVNNQMGLLAVGTVDLKFVVRADGKAEKIEVVRNSSNESFAACSVSAIVEAEIPPIPKELLPMLQGGKIEIEYSFTILSN